MSGFEPPKWTVDEFIETELGQAAHALEERMALALGEDFVSGDISNEIDLLFLNMADIGEVSYYATRVGLVYGRDVLTGQVDVISAIQGCVSQALCLGIMLERMRHDG